jgi:hypothetical protein
MAKAFKTPRLYGANAVSVHVHLLKIVSKEKSAPGAIPELLEPLSIQASWVALDAKGNVVREAGTGNVFVINDEKTVGVVVGELALKGASAAAKMAEGLVMASLEKV